MSDLLAFEATVRLVEEAAVRWFEDRVAGRMSAEREAEFSAAIQAHRDAKRESL